MTALFQAFSTKNSIWVLAQMGRWRLSSRYDFLWLRPLGLRATHSRVWRETFQKHLKLLVFRSHWSNFEVLKHPFLKIWRQVSRWNAPQIGPVFFPILFQVSCPWHFKPWHYIRGKHWPQSWVTIMGVFFYQRALKCLEHTGNLGKTTWKKIIDLLASLFRWFCCEAKSGDDSTWERARDLGNPARIR